MSEDLVKSLRDINKNYELARGVHADIRKAADRIEELVATCEELGAANKRLNEQMDAIEEVGTESLNALPDCLMRLAPALVENAELKAKLQNQTHLLGQLFALLDKTEETDDGIVFHPNQLRSCRASDTEKLSKILAELKGKDT